MPPFSEQRQAIVNKRLQAALQWRELHFIARRPPELDHLPLSYTQEVMARFIDRQSGGSFYHLFKAFRLIGDLKREALQCAVQEIVQRHESLRTTFTWIDGQPKQRVHHSSASSVRIGDLRSVPAEERAAAAIHLARSEYQQPFDLSHDLPLRTMLIQLDEQEHLFLLILHHLVCDGGSLEIPLNELACFYESSTHGIPSGLSTLPIHYGDYALWQRQQMQGVARKELAYWRECRSVGDLLVDHHELETPTFAGAEQLLHLERPLVAALKRLSSQEGTTLFMALLAVFLVQLYGRTKQETPVVGTYVANRQHVHSIGSVHNTWRFLVGKGGLHPCHQLTAFMLPLTHSVGDPEAMCQSSASAFTSSKPWSRANTSRL